MASANGGYTISLELISAVDDIEKDWFGNDEATEGGIVEKGGIKVMPRFALLAAKETYKGDKLYEIDTYFDCTAARASRNDKTSEGNFDPQFPTFTITSKPRPDNDFVRYTSYADTLPESVVVPTVKAVKAAKSAVKSAQDSGRTTATNKEVLNSLRESKEAKAVSEALRKVWAYMDGKSVVDIEKVANLLDRYGNISQAIREYKKGGCIYE